MPKKINKKEINSRFELMNDGWIKGAPSVKFMGVSQTDLNAQMADIKTDEQQRGELEAELDQLDDRLVDKYARLDDTMVSVASGVRGDSSYGDDSPLYGSMGFKRKSERSSGLTRKKKTKDE